MIPEIGRKYWIVFEDYCIGGEFVATCVNVVLADDECDDDPDSVELIEFSNGVKFTQTDSSVIYCQEV